jgi:hypothetical protein
MRRGSCGIFRALCHDDSILYRLSVPRPKLNRATTSFLTLVGNTADLRQPAHDRATGHCPLRMLAITQAQFLRVACMALIGQPC